MGDEEQDHEDACRPPHHVQGKDADDDNNDNVGTSSWRDKVCRFTWGNFTCTQSTGGIAVLLSETPHQFRGLETAGTVVFLLNLVLFVLFTAAIAARFILRPRLLRKSLAQPPEAFFTGSFLLSIATIIICIQRYAVPHTGPWTIVAVRVLFWTYSAVTLLYNTIIFAVMFARKPLQPDTMTPPMFLMIFVTMLTGTVSATIAEDQPPEQRLPIIVAGIAYQGLGWILALMMLPRFMGNLFVNGLGPADLRPGLFMPVGSSGYTIISLIGCSKAIPDGYAYFARHPVAAEALRAVALWASVFLWLFTFWLFAIALLANLPIMFPRISLRGSGKLGLRVSPKMRFTLPWWAMIFPNVGFTVGTVYIGQEFESQGILWVSTAMTILVFTTWLMDLYLHLGNILTGNIS